MAGEPLLIVRADATREMGSGHLVRSSALAQAWRSAGGRAVILARVSAALPASVERAGLERLDVAHSHPHPDDLSGLLALTRAAQDAWVVCDGYHFDAGYTRSVRERGASVLVVDDIANAPVYDADAILNQNLFAERLVYNAAAPARMLLGPSYALLRAEFVAVAAGARDRSAPVERLLVTMGGGDPFNQTEKVLRAIARVAPGLAVRVVVGNSNDEGARLEAAARAIDGSTVEFVRNPDNMALLLRWADLAISAGGSTCWELCCLGVPMTLVTFADNQAGITSGLHEAGAAESLGWYERVTETDIAAAIEGLRGDAARRADMSARAGALVDGKGAARVVSVMREMTVRRAAAFESEARRA